MANAQAKKIGDMGELATGLFLRAGLTVSAEVRFTKPNEPIRDMYVRFSDGDYWVIQVKTSHTGNPQDLTEEKRLALIDRAHNVGAIPVLAAVWLRNSDPRYVRKLKFYSVLRARYRVLCEYP